MIGFFYNISSYCVTRFYFLALWNNNNRFVIIIQQTLLKLDCRHYSFRPLDTRQGTRPSRCPICCTRSGLPYSSYHLCRCWPTCPLLKLMVNAMSCCVIIININHRDFQSPSTGGWELEKWIKCMNKLLSDDCRSSIIIINILYTLHIILNQHSRSKIS